MAVGLRHLSPEERIRAAQEIFREPVKNRCRLLEIEVATRLGGKHLEYMRVAHGYVWADAAVEPTVRTFSEAAKIMNLALSDVYRIHHEVMDEVLEKLQQTPEWQEWEPLARERLRRKSR